MLEALSQLSQRLQGELYYSDLMRSIYATDASAYEEMPLAVAFPRDEADVGLLIAFAKTQQIGLIPRTAGTSLAGQVVGKGIVVDVSKYLNQILEINAEEQWVRVQPGVIRNELNMALKPHGLFFTPETSTANRAMIGGMLGNNSCGANSIQYGTTRDHVLSIRGFLSDGSVVTFEELSAAEFQQKCQGDEASLENALYRNIESILSRPEHQKNIREAYPHPKIKRRNTGYAIDLLLETEPFTADGTAFNFCKLIAGSEGTLMLVTEIKLNLVELPPPEQGLLVAHFKTVDDALRANLIAMQFEPSACELIDHYILDCTKTNIEQRENRFFLQGEPGAIIVIQIERTTRNAVESIFQEIESAMRQAGYGYAFSTVFGENIPRVWALRNAGLGLLSNVPGDAKPVPVVEDTAVTIEDLPEYIKAFTDKLATYGLQCVHYAHVGAGEIHLRPILDLKTKQGHQLFRTVAEDITALVKQYKGSLSGEHGDGRLRGEFIQRMIGKENFEHLVQIKKTWDPQNIFNPQKIINTDPMDSSLRYHPEQKPEEPKTIFDFSKTRGMLRAAEMCNGSADCRKTHLTGGTMCPSYMATRNEKDTTRARANMLRQVMSASQNENPFADAALYEVMDLCLSCKACKRECPSNVDVTKLKAEFLQHYHDANGIPLRSRLIANFNAINAYLAKLPWLYNSLIEHPRLAALFKKSVGFAETRTLPKLATTTLNSWYQQRPQPVSTEAKRKVYLFCDEFTNYQDTAIGVKAILLLERLGYSVMIPEHIESGRSYLSKGFVRKAQAIAIENVRLLKTIISEEAPLVGIEPSAILTFCDEYIDLVPDDLRADAEALAKNCFLVEEFITNEYQKGLITKEQFTSNACAIKLHGHCYQKALNRSSGSAQMLSIPQNYKVESIPSGCCGMAGSFGYEAEHFEVSQQIGALVLFPAVKASESTTLIAASGTSCRHQIKDGTGRQAYHPVEIMYKALL